MKEFDSKTLLFIDDISNLDKPMYYSFISDDIEIPDEIIKLYKVFIIKMSWDKRHLVCTSTLKRAEQIAEWLDSISISNKLAQ